MKTRCFCEYSNRGGGGERGKRGTRDAKCEPLPGIDGGGVAPRGVQQRMLSGVPGQ
jgi:hypothetical protein